MKQSADITVIAILFTGIFVGLTLFLMGTLDISIYFRTTGENIFLLFQGVLKLMFAVLCSCFIMVYGLKIADMLDNDQNNKN